MRTDQTIVNTKNNDTGGVLKSKKDHYLQIRCERDFLNNLEIYKTLTNKTMTDIVTESVEMRFNSL